MGIAEVEEDRKVSRLIPGAKAKRRIVNIIAAMRIHAPFVWSLGHDEKTSSIFARRFNLKRDNKRVWFKGVLVEQNGEIRVVSVRKEIIRDVRDMVAGLLEDNCMEFTTGRRDNIGRISARRGWIPL